MANFSPERVQSVFGKLPIFPKLLCIYNVLELKVLFSFLPSTNTSSALIEICVLAYCCIHRTSSPPPHSSTLTVFL